jgi:hypothetical protein
MLRAALGPRGHIAALQWHDWRVKNIRCWPYEICLCMTRKSGATSQVAQNGYLQPAAHSTACSVSGVREQLTQKPPPPPAPRAQSANHCAPPAEMANGRFQIQNPEARQRTQCPVHPAPSPSPSPSACGTRRMGYTRVYIWDAVAFLGFGLWAGRGWWLVSPVVTAAVDPAGARLIAVCAGSLIPPPPAPLWGLPAGHAGRRARYAKSRADACDFDFKSMISTPIRHTCPSHRSCRRATAQGMCSTESRRSSSRLVGDLGWLGWASKKGRQCA